MTRTLTEEEFVGYEIDLDVFRGTPSMTIIGDKLKHNILVLFIKKGGI